MPVDGEVRGGISKEKCQHLCSIDRLCAGLLATGLNKTHLQSRQTERSTAHMYFCDLIGHGSGTCAGMSQHVIVYRPFQRCANASLLQVSNFEGENGDVRYGDKKSLPIATSSTIEQFQAVCMTQFTVFLLQKSKGCNYMAWFCVVMMGRMFSGASYLVVCRQHS